MKSPFTKAYGQWERVVSAVGTIEGLIAIGTIVSAGLLTTVTYWMAPDQSEAAHVLSVADEAGEIQTDEDRYAEERHAQEMAQQGWGNSSDNGGTVWGNGSN